MKRYEMKDKQNVFMVCPTLDNRINASVDLLFRRAVALSVDPTHPRKYTTCVKQGIKPVEFMWNTLAGDFLATKCEVFWKIDSDMVAGDNAFELLDTDADVCSGFFFRLDATGGVTEIKIKPCAFKRNGDGSLPHYWPTEADSTVFDVDACGGGSMVVKRHVLEDPKLRLDPEYPLFEEDVGGVLSPDEPPAIFRRLYKSNGQVFLSSDVDFCLRAGKLGYSVKVNGGVPFGQICPVDLNSIFAMKSMDTSDGGSVDAPRLVVARD